MTPSNPLRHSLLALALIASPWAQPWAWAEKADRSKPMVLESDPGKPCTVNLVKQVSQCSGNVVIAQGTLLIKGDRVELRETPEGFRMAVVNGTADKLAYYRQKRDIGEEFVEGTALRIDYDGRAGTVRFEGRALVKRLNGTAIADEVQGETVIWDSTAEEFSVQGGRPSATNPSGRPRAVLAPRAPASAASSAAASGVAASAARSSPALRSSSTLGDRR